MLHNVLPSQIDSIGNSFPFPVTKYLMINAIMSFRKSDVIYDILNTLSLTINQNKDKGGKFAPFHNYKY